MGPHTRLVGRRPCLAVARKQGRRRPARSTARTGDASPARGGTDAAFPHCKARWAFVAPIPDLPAAFAPQASRERQIPLTLYGADTPNRTAGIGRRPIKPQANAGGQRQRQKSNWTAAAEGCNALWTGLKLLVHRIFTRKMVVINLFSIISSR